VSTNPTSFQTPGAQHALTLLDALLSGSRRKRVNKDQVMLILDALAGATDSALVERFPAVLAICARSGIPLDGRALFARHWESSPKRQNLERLLLISVELLTREKLAPPGDLGRIAVELRRKYPSVAVTGRLRLSTGVSVTIDGLKRTLGRLGLLTDHAASPPPSGTDEITPAVSRLLGRLFSPKQKELVLKKLDGRPMTKTEREYYSRAAKKKLEAISDQAVQRIAERLIGSTKTQKED